MTKGGVTLDGDLALARFRETIHDELMTSLGLLGTGYVDVYMLHRDNPRFPVGDMLGPLNDEIAAGRARSIAASNWEYSRLTEAMEYADKGIRINAICPGTIDTPFVFRLTGGDEQMRQAFHESHPMRRMGRPDEIAQAVLWLCSDAASFVTGHPLAVDGGLVAR